MILTAVALMASLTLSAQEKKTKPFTPSVGSFSFGLTFNPMAIENKEYQPTKSTVIQLAVGLQLDLKQTQKLLEKAGFALTRSSKADLVVEYCIRHKLYSITFINEALYDCGLPLLKTGLKA